MAIVIFIIMLGALILIHEFGHFIVAKKTGIRVDEFGIGFPPRLLRIFKKNGTEYTINWIPFGGFVRIFGEDPTEEALEGKHRKDSFLHQPKITQMAVIGAGVAFNIISAWLLFSVIFMIGQPSSADLFPGETLKNVHVVVLDVLEDSPAEEAGVLPDDIILGVHAGEEFGSIDSITDIQYFISLHGGETVSIALERDGASFELNMVPKNGVVATGVPAIGIAMDEVGILRYGPLRSFWEAGMLTIDLTGQVALSFFGLVRDALIGRADFSQVSGPVGIVNIVDTVAQYGVVFILKLAAVISINLAVLNLLPFPALDGGRLFFLLVEAIRRKPLNAKVVRVTNMIGFILLIILMIAVTFNDIIRL